MSAAPSLSFSENRVLIIAELSANHNGSFERALELVHAAAKAGADAIKVQTYTADTLTFPSAEPAFRIAQGTLWDGRTLYDLYQEAALPWEWHEPMRNEAHALGLPFFSSPFDSTAIHYLKSLKVPAYKIASPELVDRGLIEEAAATGKPLILSTGMASMEEIADALQWARGAGAREIALLKCTSAYPADPAEMNLSAIQTLRERFEVPVGLSDHSFGATAPISAVALGAQIIEKHLTLARADGGPDSGFSMEPEEFTAMVRAVREAEAARGSGTWSIPAREQANRHFRRSLYVVHDVEAGDELNAHNVRSIRPAQGLPPAQFLKLLGRRFKEPIKAGSPLRLEHLEEPVAVVSS